MRTWDIIDEEAVPDDDGTIYLVSRGNEYAIHVDGRELMGNRAHGSEDGLADLACDRLADLESARILVGGLGMGFTLAAALRRVGPLGHATVAELLPAVVRWNRGAAGRASKHPLLDPRCSVYIGDVGDLVEHPPRPWSAILLDVDNGPKSLTRETNGWLYTRKGLHAAMNALIPGGVLGIWSAHSDDSLTSRLHKIGFGVEILDFTEHGRPTPNGSGTHVLWMATRPAGQRP
jgi:spermidine synthase